MALGFFFAGQRSAIRQPRHYLRNKLSREREFRHSRQRMRSLFVEKRYLVLVLPECVLRPIGNQERNLLLASLFLRVSADVIGLGRKAYTEGRFWTRGDSGEDIDRRFQRQRHWGRTLLDLGAALRGRCVVC